ncbi:MAG: hypothetical protein RI567_11270 [Marinobacter sp.]|nr:hypothetical protein [Marinobacter sp.]
MKEHEFTLTFSIAEGLSAGLVENRLFDAGCHDALVGLGREGRLALMFTRKAESASQAITCAINDVKRAFPKAKLLENNPVAGNESRS